VKRVHLLSLTFAALVFAVAVGLALGNMYASTVDEYCRDNSSEAECAALIKENDCRILSDGCAAPPSYNARFFAIQTITTTGYGSEVFLKVPRVQMLANLGMLFGPLFFSLFVGIAASAMTSAKFQDSD